MSPCGSPSCSVCAQYPSAWTFTTSGFSETGLNKTWTLKDSGNCLWQDYTQTAKLDLDSAKSNFLLSFAGTAILYQLALSSWNCCGPNTMNRNQGTSAAASLTVTGVDCSCVAPFCATCDFCSSASFPKAYQLAVSGFSD